MGDRPRPSMRAVFPRKVGRFHISFEDRPKLAATAKSEEEALVDYRRVRDAIRTFIERLPEVLLQKALE
jgi:arsenate reductase